MDVISLQSGSSGNCTFVSAGGTRLLIDAGLSGRKCVDRLAGGGHADAQIDAILISHDHSDHTSSMGVLHRRFQAPIHINRATLRAVTRKRNPGVIDTVTHFRSGDGFDIGALRIETLRTPHDAADGVCFVIEERATGIRFGVLTDLGHVFDGLNRVVSTLDAVLIESNYDPSMLRHSFYPQRLKDRIAGSQGHISNQDAAELLDKNAGDRLQWACLGHLSDENNTPEAALSTFRRITKNRFRVTCADRYQASPPLAIKRPDRTSSASKKKPQRRSLAKPAKQLGLAW